MDDEDRSRWGAQDPDAQDTSDTVDDPTTSDGDDFVPEASEPDEDAIVGVQPGTEADVPFNDDVPAETEEATNDGSE